MGIQLKWKNAAVLQHSVPEKWRDWLLHPGSFMQRLEQFGVQGSHVDVLRQNWVAPLQDEQDSLQLEANTEVLVREVLIHQQQKYWMFARTVFPRGVLAVERQLENLGSRSLGSVLFSDPTMRRSAFEVASVLSGSSWCQAVKPYIGHSEQTIWARRSTFFLREQPLLLTELFLPDVYTL